MRQKIKIERNASKKLEIFFMGYFRGGQKWPQPANKKSKTDIYKKCPDKFLVGFEFWSSWGSRYKNSKTPSRLDFFKSN